MKKIISLMLALVLILGCFSVESFAAFSLSSAPTVKSVEFTGKRAKSPISKAEVKEYQEMGYAENGEAFDLSFSSINYQYKVTLSNGKEIVYSNDDLYVEIDNSHVLYIEATVSAKNYNQAIKDKAKKINVDISCTIESTGFSLSSLFSSEAKPQTFTLKKGLVDRYIKSLKYVSGLSKKIYKDADYIDLKGAKFEFVYYNGNKATYTVKEYKPDNDTLSQLPSYLQAILISSKSYTLNGVSINYELTKKGIDFYYMDAPKCSKKVTLLSNPYKSIKITDYDFDASKGLQSVTFKLTKKDGKSKSYTCDTSKYVTADYPIPNMVIKSIDGYNIWLDDYDYSSSSMDGEYIKEEESADDSKLVICVSLGEKLSDSVEFEAPKSDSTAEIFEVIIGYIKTAVTYIISMINSK